MWWPLKDYGISAEEEKERKELEEYTFKKYGNYLIYRSEMAFYKKKYKNVRFRECKPKDKRFVVMERVK